MAWTEPKTWVAGERITAADLNTYVRDNFNAFGASWQTYTPSWTAVTTNPTIGNGTLSGRFAELGKWIIIHIDLQAGSTTTFGSGTYRWSYPRRARAHATNFGMGGWFMTTDASTGARYYGFVRYLNQDQFIVTGEQGGVAGAMISDFSNTFPITYAVNDHFRGSIFYEAD